MENVNYQVAEIELSYRPKFKPAERPQIDCSAKAYQVLMGSWSLDKIELVEEFKIILLNRGNRVLGIVNISQGGMSGTVADPKIIFAIALKACANGIILSHNHPSGESRPSDADIKLTQKLSEAGKLLDIKVFDHIIVCTDRYFSFLDGEML
ncbi:JAB domain-containing protein [Pedobacter psychrodurus]|uniref:JAB domain-containing protein n=1 Tax=Pedobacter psychrodurus TaxID=2530456 RepID=UPI002930219E|nr:JAB domain-containing protein [Pedobacter psychrodurus]